jgi:hypothetical protein
MKIFSAIRGKRPLNLSEAWTCLFVNQFATPGLGSLMARRWIAATGQLVLSFGGFGFIMAWFGHIMSVFYGQMFGTTAKAESPLWKWGVVLFGISWAWSLITSIQIIMAVPKTAIPPAPPPII